MPVTDKPLGRKAYGSIGHLPGSRLGPGDHKVTDGQMRICCEKARDRHDLIIVQEKVDGSCCAVARMGDQILALTRAGYLATTSPYEQHHFFAHWVRMNEVRFRETLRDGERLCGEWMAMAHGTRYTLPHEPFVVFDMMIEAHRVPFRVLSDRLRGTDFIQPRVLSIGAPLSMDAMIVALEPSGHGATDPVEGAVYRVEREGKVDFLAKYVRPEKKDGCYLPEVSGQPPIWHWRPW